MYVVNIPQLGWMGEKQQRFTTPNDYLTSLFS